MNTERLTFKNIRGETLSARLESPVDHAPIAYALFAHCFTCSKNLNAAVNISRALTHAGIAVLRFDFTGLGESEGDFADTTFMSNIDDLITAADFLETEYGASPQLLVGHSLGGAAVLQAAQAIPAVRAVATIGAPSEPKHVVGLLADSTSEIEAKGCADVVLAGRRFTIKKAFLDSLEKTNMQQVIGALKRALLVLHSPIDNTVSIDNAADIFMSAKHPKSFISLDNADHLLSRDRDSEYAGSVIAQWAQKYLEAQHRPSWKDNVADNRIAVRTEAGLRTAMMANGHSLVADEPRSLGGTETGPNPYDYLAAALGACTSMTLRMYADRKKWPLEAVEVSVKHRKVHAKDSPPEEGKKPRRLDQFNREIEVFGPLDDEQKQRLLEIANRCPVHRTLEGEVEVNTALKEAEAVG